MARTFKAKAEMSGFYRGLAVVIVLAAVVSFTLSFFSESGFVGVFGSGAMCVMNIGIAIVLVSGLSLKYAVGDDGLTVSNIYWKHTVPYAEIDLTTGGRYGVFGVSIPNLSKNKKTTRTFLPLPKEKDEFLNALKNRGVLF